MYSQIYFDRDDIVAGAIGFIATAGEMHVLITDGGFFERWHIPTHALLGRRKGALQQAAAAIAERLLPKLVL